MVTMNVVQESLLRLALVYSQKRSQEAWEIIAEEWIDYMPESMTDEQFVAALKVAKRKSKFFPVPPAVVEAWEAMVSRPATPKASPAKVLPFEGTTAHKDQCAKNQAKAREILDRLKKKLG